MTNADTFEVSRPDDPDDVLRTFETVAEAEHWAQDQVVTPAFDALTVWKRGSEGRSFITTVTRQDPTTTISSPTPD
jgi:hypothetical protein